MTENWAAIWNTRSPERADWNGYEACFPDRAGYDAYHAAMAAFVADTLRIGPQDVVADLGCGTGITAHAVAGKAASVLAVDYSRVALEVAGSRRARGNLRYEWADLNDVDPDLLRQATKAYAVGSILYLDSRETAFRLIDGLIGNGTDTLLTDLPDRRLVDERRRDYDTTQFRHLQFDESEFAARFPDAEVTIHRNLFPGYINDALRFTVRIRPS